MARLPSLACLALTSAKPEDDFERFTFYEDDREREDLMMRDLHSNALYIQKKMIAYLLGTFDDAATSNRKNEIKAVLLRMERIFAPMIRAIQARVFLRTDKGETEFFQMPVIEDSAVPLIKAFQSIDLSPESGIKEIAAGGFNTSYVIDLTAGPSSNPNMEAARAILKTTGEESVILRKSKKIVTKHKMYDVLAEFAFQAYTSKTGVGPKLFYVWCTPADTPYRFREEDYIYVHARTRITEIYSVMERFDGDLGTMFKNPVLNLDLVDRERNALHGFWRANGECMVRALKHDVLHLDLRPANMLFRKVHADDGSSHSYIVRYTDFDPEFVTILDLDLEYTNTDSKEGMRLCFGVLSLHMMLAEARCRFKDRPLVEHPDGTTSVIDWATVYDMAVTGFNEAFKAEFGPLSLESLEGLCTWDKIWTEEPLIYLKEKLVRRLHHWANHYLNKPECKKFDRLLNFNMIAAGIVEFARHGQ
jgi:hypothetical protein